MRASITALSLALLSLAAFADDDDKVMGNYHGKFTGGTMANAFIRAEVVALSKTSYRAVLFAGATEQEAERVEMRGRRENAGAPVQFEGEVSLKVCAGACGVTATIENETMRGTLQCKGAPQSFELKRVFLQSPTLGAAPPAGAVVLMDGKNLDAWVRDPEKWCLQPDGSTTVCSSNFKTTQEFGSGTYHVEFKTPFMPDARDQGRGNSGVYILGRYEVQVLDSFGDLPADNLCGGIYKKATPTSMAALPPLQWQTYDITFVPASFDAAGKKTKDAEITVVQNGMTIHDHIVLPGLTPGGVSGEEASTGPLMLQDHHNDVSYRNIWFQSQE